jgi:hypothetical protein
MENVQSELRENGLAQTLRRCYNSGDIASTLQGVLLSQPDGLQPRALSSAATTLEEAAIGHRSLEG